MGRSQLVGQAPSCLIPVEEPSEPVVVAAVGSRITRPSSQATHLLVEGLGVEVGLEGGGLGRRHLVCPRV
jgi:hypothetical protein